MNKACWIIGASSGIGHALAFELEREGYTLILSARTKDKLDQLKSQLNPQHDHQAIVCDVEDMASLRSAYAFIQLHFQNLDLMIYAAGTYTPMFLKDFDLKPALQTLQVNLLGAFNVFDVIKPLALDATKPFHMAWISSVAGYRGLPSSCAYGISKAGLTHFAEIQRVELAQHNTKVQVVTPGFVKTRLTDKNTYSMPFIITPEDAAKSIVKGLRSNTFNISFPFGFSFIMKLFRILPDFLFFFISTLILKSRR